MNGANAIHTFLINKVYDEETIGYRETFKILLLNNTNKAIGHTTISEEGLTSTIVDVRLIMQTALVMQCYRDESAFISIPLNGLGL